jgi:hypothetical protein
MWREEAKKGGRRIGVKQTRISEKTNRLLSFHYALYILYDRTAYETPTAAVLLLFQVHSLLRERVYRAIAANCSHSSTIILAFKA